MLSGKGYIMKKLKKIAATIGLLALATLSLTACGKKKSADKWVVGTNAEFPPFEYVSTSQGVIDKFAGIDIEIIKKIAEENGKTVEINNMEFDSLTVALANGQINIAVAGMTITEERKQAVDFSDPYYVAKQVMIVREDTTDVKKATDMAGKKIAVVMGYTGQTEVENLGYKENMVTFKKGTEAIQELLNKKCDVVVIDSATASKYVKDNPGLVIVEDDDTFTSESYGIAVKKGDTETLNMINAAIKKMKEDGTIDEISAKYAEGADENASSSDAE